MSVYLTPLKIKEKRRVRAVVKGQLVGTGFDETPSDGEAIATTARGAREDMSVFQVALRIRWLETSVDNVGISACLVTDVATEGQINLNDVLDINCDSAAPNLLAYESTLSKVMPYADLDPCLPHTGQHVGDEMHSPELDELVKDYNTVVVSNYARKYYQQVNGHSLEKNVGSIRWWAKNVVIRSSIHPHLADGGLMGGCWSGLRR